MTFSQRLRHSRGWLLLLVGALVLSFLPARMAEAREQLKDLDNTVQEFVGGKFQRGSANNYQSPSDSTDAKGAVQLSTIGLLKFQNNASSSLLPVTLQQMGAAVINDHIYVIGGVGPSGPVNTVYSARVDLTNGSLPDGWVTEAPLNGQKGSDSLTQALSAIVAPGVATASVGGSNYLYVIGGQATTGSTTFSSYAVRSAKVGTDGHIASGAWAAVPGANIPDNDPDFAGSNLGLEAPAVTTFTVPETGVTYIYIFGGLQRGPSGSGGTGQTSVSGSVAIFAARVGTNGGLFKANTSGDTTANQGWQRMSVTIPIKDEDITDPAARDFKGLWDSVAVADRFFDASGLNHVDSIFLMGGQIAPAISGGQPTYSASSYQFYIGQNGQIDTKVDTALLPTARHGLSGIEFRGNFYLTGGISGNATDPDRTVLTSSISDTLVLTRFGPQGSPNFLPNAEGLPIPRAFHKTVLVQNNAGAGFIYVIGGRGSSSPPATDDNGSNTVYYSQLNTDEVETAGYASDGWYYSKPFSLSTQAVDVREINWSTFFPVAVDGLNIGMEFRVSADVDCNVLQSSRTALWQKLNSGAGVGKSVNGFNKVEQTGINGRCFQYRAHLTSVKTTKDFPTETPLLLKFSVKIVIPGSADLKVNRIIQNKSGTDTTGVSASIINRNDTTPPTLAADIDGGGSFFVDLFVFQGTVVTPTLPLNDDAILSSEHVGCAQVPNSAMQPSSVYTITTWLDPTCTTPITVTAIFPNINTTYTVMVAVDTGCPNNKFADVSYGCINELDATGGEANNISSVRMTVTGTKDVPIIVDPAGKMPLSLPLISVK